MIPPLNQFACLPEGIHECTIDEAASRFVTFQTTDRRPQLWAKFTEFVRELGNCDSRGEERKRKFWSYGQLLSADQTATRQEEGSFEDRIMIETVEQLYQAIEQMGRMQRVLESYRNEILTRSPRNFALFAE
jgi:hypothetical protein